jgi:NitT/TauT family transport system substrate-binding protein
MTNQNISFLPAGVALKKGCLKDEGLDIELIRMNTPNIITALMTVDIGYTLLLGSVIRGALRGMPLRVVASLLDSPTHAVVTKSEIKSLKELRGKTIGIGNFGGTDEVVAKMVFKNAGIDPDKEIIFF